MNREKSAVHAENLRLIDIDRSVDRNSRAFDVSMGGGRTLVSYTYMTAGRHNSVGEDRPLRMDETR